MTTPRDQAEAILELSHQSQRKPNIERLNGAEKYERRVEIDAILAQKEDDKQLRDEIGVMA